MSVRIAEGWERRVSSSAAQVDLSEDRRIRGYAIMFNSLSENMGGFREIIKPEAVDRTLRTAADVRALWNHNESEVLGRTRAGTLALFKDQKGLKVEINPPSWAGRYLETIERGDVSGMSFAFRVLPGGAEWDEETSPPTRYILDMEISEVSAVTFPAYETTDVQVAQRSLQQIRAQRVHDWRQKLHEIHVIRYGS